ncbi:MAG: protein kinase domain-containing protein [Actinomycetota bacterium]
MKTMEARQSFGDRYVITGRIGSGGMGEVLRARDSTLGRTVALKVLPVGMHLQPGVVERFRAEAQATARVSHPNVVQVHDWGEEDDAYYMVMEYVRGRTLRQILAAGPLEPAQACDAMVQILAGLAAAHDKGLVHRDIKPENILVAVDGTVKVTDFGIARLVEAAGLTGSLMGTVAYAAPEQAKGAEIDGRTDLYSAGCVFYELLTGSMPYEGDAVSILHQHLTDRVPAPSIQEPGTASLDPIILRATAPEAKDRYPSASEMRRELISAGASLPGSPPLADLTGEVTGDVSPDTLATVMVEQKKRKRSFRRAVLLLLAVGLGAAGFFFRPALVPDIAGLPRNVASKTLVNSRLTPVFAESFSDAPKGSVIKTSPGQGGWVLKDGKVKVVVSAGPQLTDAPSVTGLDLNAAKRQISASGLSLGKIEERHDRQAAGIVLDQTPKPGRVRRDDPVNLVVSSGPENLPLPETVGKKYDEASAALVQKGFTVSRQDAFSDAPAGQVVFQAPKSGEMALQGTDVRLSVSKGPQPVAMPDLKGKACSEARGVLAAQGLAVKVTSSGGGEATCGGNKVLAQDPLPGATVRKGREATLYVS